MASTLNLCRGAKPPHLNPGIWEIEMARARNIKPSFFQNEELGELAPIDRLAFIAMWTIADFRGCIEFRAKRLKIQLLPYDDCDIEEIAFNLDKSGLIRIYSVQGQRYIKIVNFEKHQNPHKNERESGSEIPDYEEKHREIKELKNIEINPDKNGTAPADSLFPLTDSFLLKPECENPESKTKRATRLPSDWEPSQEDIDYCKKERKDLVWQKVAENFRDYWIAKSGKDATKLDWSATWRSWVRKESPPRTQSQAKPEKFDPTAYVNRNKGMPDDNIIDIN